MLIKNCKFRNNDLLERLLLNNNLLKLSFSCWCDLWGWIINFDIIYTILWFEPICFMRLISLYVNKFRLTTIINTRLSKHFSIVGLMITGLSPDSLWLLLDSRTRTGLGLGLGLWSNGLRLGLGLWSNGLGLAPDGLGLWPDGLGLGLWPCGLGLTAELTNPDSLQL